ncbi:MAG: DUF4249 domain-containing protein [Prolixibacteraceae bacterium]|jgi:hypothetical protein
MKKYIFYSVLVVTLNSCTKTLDFDDSGLANQVVVNSIISPDSYFTSYITKSSSILEDRQNNPAADGSMDLYEDGNLIRQFPTQSGGFSDTNIFPEAGKTYRMVVTSNGKTLEAETKIPNQAEVISVDTSTVKNEFGQWTNYKVNIKDPSGEDYYRLVLMSESLSFYTSKDSLGNDKRYYMANIYQSLFNSDDPVFKSLYNNFGQDVIDAGPNNDYAIFTDDYFQGKEYSLQFNVYYGGGYGYSDAGNPKLSSGVIYVRSIIHVQKLSKELFKYLKYLNLYDFYHDNPFSEPVPVYSNVQNGIGIFAGFNDDTKFDFEKIYIPYSMDTIKVEDGYYGGGYYYGNNGN